MITEKKIKGVKFNINDFIRVKLTEEGLSKLSFYYHEKVSFLSYNDTNELIKGFLQEDGFYKFQLHVFMNIFGNFVYNGASLLFERNEIIFELNNFKEIGIRFDRVKEEK